jgi:hypothetical protein
VAAGIRQELHERLSLRDHLLVLLALTLMTAGYLYPYLMNPAGFYGSGDDAVFANAFWWFRKCLFELKNPFISEYLFYPSGMNLVFHTTTYANFLLTLPIQLVAGVNVAVNSAYFLTFVLTGYTTFLLVHELTGCRSAAFISAVIYAFTPFHFGHGRAHLHMSTLQWIPLYFLFLWRALVSMRVIYAVCAGVVFGLILLTDQLQTISTVLVSLLILLAAMLSVGKDWQLLKAGMRQVLIAGVVATVSASVYVVPLLRELLQHRAATKVEPLAHGGANMFSADILGFFLPGFHRLWGGAFATLDLGKDSIVYFGWIALALAGYGVWHCRRERVVHWTLGIAVCFWIMSLGTYLHIGGVWEFGTVKIPLPYLAMTDIPMIGENRTPCRFHLMTMLAVAILAGFGVREVLTHARWAARYPQRLSAGVLLGLLVIETIPPVQKPGETPIPAVYTAMAQDQEYYSVLQLPLSRWSALYKNGSGGPAIMMYMQTVHQKPIFGGLASRLVPEDLAFPPGILDLLKELSSYDNMLAQRKEHVPETEMEAARQEGRLLAGRRDLFLKQYNVGYITVNPPISGKNTLSMAFLEAFTGKEFSMDTASGTAYLKVR